MSSGRSITFIKEKLKQCGLLYNTKKNIILLNHNASEKIPIRRWPLDNFILLAKKILDANLDNYIVIIGTKLDKPEAERIIEDTNSPRIIDFTGETTIKELIDLFNISHVFITNDSGPAHFASLTDIRILDIFGPETPKSFSPISKNIINFYADYFCSPCISIYNQKRTNCSKALCLNEISVESIYKEIINSLPSRF
jgi:ADP-heptose:LPS heptosyltransferase